MANKEECDRFANEMAHRFEELVQWAIENWPDSNRPLQSSDFSESRKEIGLILGPRLSEGRTDLPESPGEDGGAPYVQTTPAPWP